MDTVSKAVHIVKQDQGWAVKRSGGKRAASLHKTQAEARASAWRLALESGGAEVVIHRADGAIRHRVGAAKIDEIKSQGESAPRQRSSPPLGEGPRTTLRLPGELAELAAQLGEDLKVSRNDAIVRLATQGAAIYERSLAVQAKRDQRWAAVVPEFVDIDDAEFPSPEEAREAVLESRADLLEATDG